LHTDTGSELQDHLAKKHPEEVVDSTIGKHMQERKFKRKSSRSIVVDGNNVCYHEGDPKIILLKKVRAQLMKSGFKPTIFVSSALRHDIDNPAELNRLINVGWFIEVEGGEDDDLNVIEEAQRKQCKIVSNDNFKEYLKDYASDNWKLANSIRNFKFENGKFTLS